MEGESREEEAFSSFARRRQSLNQSLEESRRAIDSWFERQPLPPPISALANLEVLLKTRRDLLEQLINLDDEFMIYLIQIRSRGGSEGSN